MHFVKAKGKHFEHTTHIMMCCSTTVNNLLSNLHYSFFVSQFTTFNQDVVFEQCDMLIEFLWGLLKKILGQQR